MSLAALAAFAVANNNSAPEGRTPVYELTIEEARARVRIQDGNKKPKADGTQALTLSLGKIKLSLDAVAPKATRVNAPAEQVVAFTAALQEAIDNGTFDAAIIDAQRKANPANKPVVVVNVEATQGTGETLEVSGTPDGVDLDSLDE